MMESLDELVTLVTDNVDGGVVPAWVAGRLIQALKERDEEIKRLETAQKLSKYDNDLD